MKKNLTAFLLPLFIIVWTAICFISIRSTAFETNAAEEYRALYLMDYDTGTVIKKENEDNRYPIASMVKIMTLLLSFEEIDAGKMTFDEKLRISDYAASMGGSQLFLEAGDEYPVRDLIKGVTVCSANDAAVALGERISGSNEEFVVKMNARAQELGMTNTVFCNATGLPDSGIQYSTAKDVSVMMRSLLSHPEYYEFTKITLEDYVHPDGRKTQMVNTNKLIRSYAGCDAGKTGFTNEAMFCLSSSAKKGDTRIITTILGCPDSKTRFRKVSECFTYAFSNYETRVFIRKGEAVSCDIAVQNGKNNISELICDTDLCAFGKKGELNEYTLSITTDNPTAPINRSQVVGKVSLIDPAGNTACSGNLYSGTDIDKQSFFDHFKNVIDHWKIFNKR